MFMYKFMFYVLTYIKYWFVLLVNSFYGWFILGFRLNLIK